MKKNRVLKIIFVLLFCLMSNTYGQGYGLSEEQLKLVETDAASQLFFKCLNNYYDRLAEGVKTAFSVFEDLLASKEEFADIGCGWIHFNPANTNLFIGNSGAVWGAYTMGNEELDKYGFDVISFGGAFDYNFVDWLKLLDKKYNNIVIFGGVSDLNVRAFNGSEDVDAAYCLSLHNLYGAAKDCLASEYGNVYFINIKPMTCPRDHYDETYVNKYNQMAAQVNENIEKFGFKPYEIKYETTLEYSTHYIHFNNKVVFETLFGDITTPS